MDRLDAMKMLTAAVDAGSLSGAARRIGTPLATVSRKISDLEAHLKTRLLIRSSRKLVLTEAGQNYLVACRRILEQVAEAERAAAGEYSVPMGKLTMATPVAFGRLHVLPVATEFLKAYPQIDLRMILSDRISHILEEHIDLAIRLGELPDSSFMASKVGDTGRIVCASPEYFAARGMPQEPGDLAAHDCVTFEPFMSPDSWTFPGTNGEETIAIHSRLVVNTAHAAVDAAIAGAGITRVLSYQAAGALWSGALVTALQAFEPPRWPINLVHAGQTPLPLKVRAFLDFAAPRLKARLKQ